jgi:hypothetical protein
MHKLRVLCGAAMLAACLAPAAHADEWTKLTYFTFSAPVEMPGIVLPAGTYKFELADPDSSRRVVRVSDKEGAKVHGTFLSISNQMMDPADKPLVMFKEAPAGAPEAVKAWFYPGESTGYEFVYPHDQALKIAKSIHSPVLTAKGEVTGTTLASDTARIDENDRVASPTSTTASTSTSTTTAAESTTAAAAAAQQTPPPSETTTATTTTTTAAAPTPAPAPEPAPTTTATTAAPPAPTAQAVAPPATIAPQPVTTPRGTTITEPAPVGTTGEAASTAPRRHLPGTSSLLPLMELLSGLSMAGGFAFRALRKSLA